MHSFFNPVTRHSILAPTGALEEAILYGPLSVRDIMLRRALKEFLKHYKESRGVLGQERAQASKQAGKQTGKQAGKQAGKHASKQANMQASKQAKR